MKSADTRIRNGKKEFFVEGIGWCPGDGTKNFNESESWESVDRRGKKMMDNNPLL